MAIKLIALDLDGTFTNDDKQITDFSRDILKKAAEKGVAVALASGRPVLGITPVADYLNLKNYKSFIMAFNGGQIIDYQSGETVYQVEFKHEYIPEAVKFSKKYNLPLITYNDTEILSEGPLNDWARHEEHNCNQKIKIIDSFDKYIDFPIVKMLMAGDPVELNAPEADIAEHFKGRLDIYRAANYFLELMPKGINKAQGLEVIANYMGITRDEIMACGDADNDVTMMQYAGLGVAVSNATEKTLAAADYITQSNNDDGVAHAIEKFILNV